MSNPRDPVVGTWAGEEKFSCPFCPFDSLQRDRVTFHIENVHPLPPVKEKPEPAPKPATVTKGAKS